MRHYRVPYRVYKPTARSKAVLPWGMTGERLKQPDVKWLEFDAASHAEAQRRLQELILPADPRPVSCRNQVSLYAMERELTPAEAADVDAMVDAIRSL